ncbi:hypothetical protein B0T24DRAFT_673364 [Lasiosphaeria ovina]|uniref:Uncharacterized protein n=1 Tax=Lasiosphaeria ovina TaxID=92902 RepID=A0AAE0NLC5_9PEZI|nr:hypothetical protein B0T24DRAFT_673364 [Lasiosphaeria ovina]
MAQVAMVQIALPTTVGFGCTPAQYTDAVASYSSSSTPSNSITFSKRPVTPPRPTSSLITEGFHSPKTATKIDVAAPPASLRDHIDGNPANDGYVDAFESDSDDQAVAPAVPVKHKMFPRQLVTPSVPAPPQSSLLTVGFALKATSKSTATTDAAAKPADQKPADQKPAAPKPACRKCGKTAAPKNGAPAHASTRITAQRPAKQESKAINKQNTKAKKPPVEAVSIDMDKKTTHRINPKQKRPKQSKPATEEVFDDEVLSEGKTFMDVQRFFKRGNNIDYFEKDTPWECCGCLAQNSRFEFLCSGCHTHSKCSGCERIEDRNLFTDNYTFDRKFIVKRAPGSILLEWHLPDL